LREDRRAKRFEEGFVVFGLRRIKTLIIIPYYAEPLLKAHRALILPQGEDDSTEFDDSP